MTWPAGIDHCSVCCCFHGNLSKYADSFTRAELRLSHIRIYVCIRLSRLANKDVTILVGVAACMDGTASFSACYICKSPNDIAGSGRNQYPQNDRNTTTSSALMARPSLLVLRGQVDSTDHTF